MTATTEQPSFYAPGAAYTVTGDATLYTLYSYVEGEGGIVYERISSAPVSWAGNWLISYGVSPASTFYFLKGLSGNASHESSSAGGSVTFASTGMRYADDRISDASASYVWNASPDGSYFKLQLDPFLQ